MKLRVVAVGRDRSGLYAPAVEEYAGRIARYVRFELVEVPEARKHAGTARAKDEEGEALLARLGAKEQGGLLAQEWDQPDPPVREGRVATKRAPTDEEWKALQFAWTVVRHVKSNAIVYATSSRTIGIGAGQMSRVDAARFGIEKSLVPLRGAAMASDAFFPFRDGLDAAAEAGVSAVVQPGGSIRDDEVVAAADERGLKMVLVGRRHFWH